MHEERVEFDNGNGAKLVGIFIMPNEYAPIVILAHGLGSSKDSGSYIGLQNGFAALGIGTLRFDFYGHGESDGKFENFTVSEGIRDVQQAFHYLRARYPHAKIGLTGSSIGGAAVYYAAPDLDITGVAPMCPALDNQKVWKKRAGAAKIKEWEKKGTITYTTYAGQKKKLAYHYYEDAGNHDPEKVKITAPVLIVHGDKDTTVPYASSQAICKSKGYTLLKIKGADHNFTGDGQQDKRIDAVINFFVADFSMDPDHTHAKVL
ncbi:alpha/beta hydrolase [Candidatus Woesearchaeota archaeon]|nr:alpha/beta hydrolase [Candidatus Woesearchaeota archaeon]